MDWKAEFIVAIDGINGVMRGLDHWFFGVGFTKIIMLIGERKYKFYKQLELW